MPNQQKNDDSAEDLKALEEQVVAELGGATLPAAQVDEFKQKVSELEAVYGRLESKTKTKKTEVKGGLERLKVLKTELAKEIDEIKNLEALSQKIKDEIKHLEELQEEVNKTNV
jgi:hypothetical protein